MAAEDFLGNGAAKLAPNIFHVASCSLPDASVHYRAIVFTQGFEHLSSVVYLQWLEWNQDGPKLLMSERIVELSSGFWSAGAPSVNTQDCSFLFPVQHSYSNEASRFELQPADLGKYAIRQDEQR